MPQAQSQTPAEQIFYYHNDHLGTPKVLTDQTGAVVWDVDYTPFGEISAYVTNTLPVDQPFRFPGQYQDTLTGLYYNWNRYYMPETGRYNRVDPSPNCYLELIEIDSIVYSTFLYSNNNPLIYKDIEGLYGTKDCSYYDKKCRENPDCDYHCKIAPRVCKGTLVIESKRGDCIRKCLQDCDLSCWIIKDKCEKCPTIRCTVECHYWCYDSCLRA